jgi:tetrahydromethanopterin S-methyltransferase subunit G
VTKSLHFARVALQLSVYSATMAVMPAPRESWTDERLDDLATKVDDGFREVRAEMRQFRTEVGSRFDGLDARLDSRCGAIESRFDAIDSRFGAIESRFDAIDPRFGAIESRFDAIDPRFEAVDSRIDARFDAMQRLIIQVGAGLFGTMLIGFASILATVLATQS